MVFANSVRVDQYSDHFILHFSLKKGESPSGKGPPPDVATVAVPLMAGVDAALRLFEAMAHAMPQLQKEFTEIQERIQKLNQMSVAMKK